MDRRAFIGTLAGGLLAAPLAAEAQPGGGRVPRVGLLGATSEAGYARQIQAMRQGFRDLGYFEGQTIVIEYRWAQGHYDRLSALATELIRLQPDVIVTSGPGIRVVKEATATIPIVMAAGGDVVANGLVTSLARPGGNITGSTFFGPELSGKRLELLKEAVPGLARVAIVLNPVSDYHLDLERVRKTAAALKLEVFEAPARSPREFGEALALMHRRRADGVTCLSDSMLAANMRRLGELSVAKGLPGAGADEFAEAVACWPTGLASPNFGGGHPTSWTRSSREASRPRSPLSKPRNSSWSSTSRPPKLSA